MGSYSTWCGSSRWCIVRGVGPRAIAHRDSNSMPANGDGEQAGASGGPVCARGVRGRTLWHGLLRDPPVRESRARSGR
ncbi:hypothetical protein CERSUDRAFT_81667 [Gelatoporia subvermispora B]|uniref:Uncharacterized protein n=1 Tax=Ceriporiopsis subvermispora (strain B) TaxID=914234 RepID=M2PQN0_CERS8|nr:hypothetical protein CERSUDRAFT_81667 [Gelatoporia subvermispora B]